MERDLQAKVRARQKQKNESWSKQNAKKQEKSKKKEKRNMNRQRLKLQANQSEDSKAVKRHAEEGGDWDDLAREERMMKKVKRGEVASEDFDREFGGL